MHSLSLYQRTTLSWHTSVCLDNQKTNRNYNLCLNAQSSGRSQACIHWFFAFSFHVVFTRRSKLSLGVFPLMPYFYLLKFKKLEIIFLSIVCRYFVQKSWLLMIWIFYVLHNYFKINTLDYDVECHHALKSQSRNMSAY